MKKIIYTLVLFFTVSGSVKAQWTDLNAPQITAANSGHEYSPLAISKNGKNIVAYSSKTVWSPGYANTKHFVVSKDFGATWTENTAPASSPIQFFWEGDILFLQESLSKILKKSTDFGATFTNQNEDIFTVGTAEKICQLAPDNWILITTISRRIMQSTDMGVTWNDKGSVNVSAGPNLFSYTTAKNGNLISTGVTGAAYSSDNGLTWSPSTLPTTLPNSADNTVSVSENGDILLFVFPSKLIFKSTDNGQNFSAVTSNLPSTAGNCMYYNNDIICIGTDAATYKSTDGGTTFTKMTEPNAIFKSSLFGTKTMIKNNGNLYVCGLNKILRYGSGASSLNEQSKKAISFKVFPNPANNKISLEGLSHLSSPEITVHTLEGKLALTHANGDESIDISTLETGVYLVKVKDSMGNVGFHKFVKE
ncbi:MAG: T9SS type A sorting domain-containing protein [Bacteroidota bacterium]|nr:T9SS type A sorting domain-containing protein [Bacteroidota bacterium]